eukprot:CAMPEP_0194573032 /NCGR_PEP_ID=MMETSP0292-20121207/9381_1 /TAXON_ID=39354 /ORGANISM="Heterosigma akashiwo, Strain CCMP2393" /LENGTH=57 /DNA_ID=CAMNT_0039424143 /DNA_START=264 /DNA_END=435 /DNA_ORIENTATION=-
MRQSAAEHGAEGGPGVQVPAGHQEQLQVAPEQRLPVEGHARALGGVPVGELHVALAR